MNHPQIIQIFPRTLEPKLPLLKLLIKCFRVQIILHDSKLIRMFFEKAEAIHEEGLRDTEVVLDYTRVSLEAYACPILLLFVSFVLDLELLGGLRRDDGKNFQVLFVLLKDLNLAVRNLL